MATFLQFSLIGLFATLVMDLTVYWISKWFRLTPTSCDLTGRLIGTLLLRRHYHRKITEIPSLRYERQFGYLGHYIMGAIMVTGFLMIVGKAWIASPQLLPLVIFLSILILFPFCVLQPAFGFGFFGSKTQNPTAARQRVVLGYLGFGLGIYLGAYLMPF